MCSVTLECESSGNYMDGAYVTTSHRGTKDKPGDYLINMPRATGSYVAGGTVVFEAWGRWR